MVNLQESTVSTTSIRLVLRPAFSFGDLSGTLEEQGWLLQPGPSSSEALLPGEPEWALWKHGGGSSRIVYTFNPAVMLRVARIYDAELSAEVCGEVLRALPTLESSDLASLLDSNDDCDLLLALFAVAELEESALLDRVQALQSHSEPMVARAAARTLDILSGSETKRLLKVFVARERRNPGTSLTFPLIADVRLRRQLLRRILADNSSSSESIDACLRSAMEDPDWEVRMTAVLVAGRLEAVNVLEHLSRAEIPGTGASGLDRFDREVLHAVREWALERVSGRSGGSSRAQSDLRVQIQRCCAGAEVDRYDRVFLLTTALTEPLPDTELYPPCIEVITGEEDGRIVVPGSGIEFVWIPAVPHWLGDDRLTAVYPHPIGRVTPPDGFLIARHPLSTQLCTGGRPAHPNAGNDASRISFSDAERVLADLSVIEGLTFRLPTADQWEMAARGPDGRRFPWGIGAVRGLAPGESPWGLAHLLEGSEWARADSANGSPCACGSDHRAGCSLRLSARPDELHAVRPVIDTAS